MALQDRERRVLAEIERHLVEEAPDLASELTNLTPLGSRRSRSIIIVVGMVTTFVIAVMTILVGVVISSRAVIVLGAVLTASLPLGVAWRRWRNRSR